ncbi:XRE family transcriptional regulator, partial [Candidatus Atribacteria bacterium 1244-E10-H5-B2]
EKKGLTQVELALLMEVSQVHISQFETGGLIPSENQTKKISKILGTSLETLNKELHQFYEARKKELEKKMEKGQNNA